MNPVQADASAAAILEGVRRAMAERPASAIPRDNAALTDVIESATEHAQGLSARLPGTGERLDRTV